MISGAAGLRAAAIFAVFAVLVMSSQGHHRRTRRPLCSDCESQCITNCSAIVTTSCSGDCNPSAAGCQSCESQVLQLCCQYFCNSSNNATSNYSCCPSDCIVGGDCVSCSCDYCKTAVQNSCMVPCSLHADDYLRCQACMKGVGQECSTSCISACKHHCVKKGKHRHCRKKGC